MKKILLLGALLGMNLCLAGCNTPADKKADAEKKIEQANTDEQKAASDANAKVENAQKEEAKADAKAEQKKADAAQDAAKADAEANK